MTVLIKGSYGASNVPLTVLRAPAPPSREQRKLAAILAADVVGYSRLMGRYKSGTLARFR